ncbi:MAG: hypothetical protein A4E53_01669 [Pelotomaculum sp. PtaB.Bin104]|nr:MAG: hypothetical protein A4E53_01669 [Pelotomaculum sp. PtaB.Bin104]
MPTVPRITENRVLNQPVLGVRVSANTDNEAFGYGESAQRSTKASQQAASTLQNIALVEKEKADKIKVRDATAKMAEFENEFLYNPQTGAVNKRGENAFSLQNDFNEAYQKKVEEINKSLSNRIQRMAFSGVAQEYRVNMERTVNRHIAGERLEYDMSVTDSVIRNESNVAMNSFQDPRRVALAFERIDAAIDSFAEANGMPKEWTEAKKFDDKSRVHIGVVENLLTRNTKAAMEYFMANKEEINQGNLNEADLKKKIDAYQKINVYKIEDGIYDKMIAGTATVDDVLSVSSPIEEGGIGSKRAKQLIDKLKAQQKSDLKTALSLISGEVSEEEAVKYIDLVDKILSRDSDNFNAKKMLVDAMADGMVDKGEAQNINNIKQRLEDINFNNSSGIFVDIFKWFKKVRKDDNLSNERIMSEIKFLLRSFSAGGQDPETFREMASERLKGIQQEKDPRIGGYYEGQEVVGKNNQVYVVKFVDGKPTFIPK